MILKSRSTGQRNMRKASLYNISKQYVALLIYPCSLECLDFKLNEYSIHLAGHGHNKTVDWSLKRTSWACVPLVY